MKDVERQQKRFFDDKYSTIGKEALLENIRSIDYSIDYKKVKELFKKLNLGETSLVLDISCGDRPQSFIFSPEAGSKVIGIDFSENGLRQAARNKEGVGVKGTFMPILGDATKLPFKERTFDAVIHSMALEHLDNPWASVEEASRVLKGGGKIFLYTPNENFLFRQVHHKVFPSHLNSLGHSKERIYTFEEIRPAFRENGLSVEECSYLFNMVSAIWDLILLPRFLRLLPRGSDGGASRFISFIAYLLRGVAVLDRPFKRLGNSSALAIIAKKG